MSSNINLMMFMMFLYMMGMFSYIYHQKIYTNKYLAIFALIMAGCGALFTFCVECRIF